MLITLKQITASPSWKGITRSPSKSNGSLPLTLASLRHEIICAFGVTAFTLIATERHEHSFELNNYVYISLKAHTHTHTIKYRDDKREERNFNFYEGCFTVCVCLNVVATVRECDKPTTSERTSDCANVDHAANEVSRPHIFAACVARYLAEFRGFRTISKFPRPS